MLFFSRVKYLVIVFMLSIVPLSFHYYQHSLPQKLSFDLGHAGKVIFDHDIHYQSHPNSPQWHWSLDDIRIYSDDGLKFSYYSTEILSKNVPPLHEDDKVVYERGAITEQYLKRGSHFEQQFVIHEPLQMSERERLVIRGTVNITGVSQKDVLLKQHNKGWSWQTPLGDIYIGDVAVYDADRKELPAQMLVALNSTEIVLSGEHLLDARYPITIDPTIGSNSQFRISTTGVDGNALQAAISPAVALDTNNNQYLVVWSAEDVTDNEFEIYGQLFSDTGSAIGGKFQISEIGPNGNINHDAQYPAVAFDPNNNRYLVVWEGDHSTDDEFEIHGQLLTAGGGDIGGDFQISSAGPTGNVRYDASHPAVSFDTTNSRYLIVWSEDVTVGPTSDTEHEIFGQLLDHNGADVGSSIQISDMGPAGSIDYDAIRPEVVFNAVASQHLIIWSGNELFAFGAYDFEIYGQLLDSNGAAVGVDDFQISAMGTDTGTDMNGFIDGTAFYPNLSFDSNNNQYLVVWQGSQFSPHHYVYGQLLDANGNEIGTDDFQLSSTSYQSGSPPDIIFDGGNDLYLVVWEGNGGDSEIMGQLLDQNAVEVGPSDFQISEMGPAGNTAFDAEDPALVFNLSNNQHFVVWHGDDNTGTLVDSEFEIYGHQLDLYSIDSDNDGATIIDDCDDGDAARFPGNAELCDSVDNDCNTATVDGSSEVWLGNACDGGDADLCNEGTFSCVGGVQSCSDSTGDNAELCDGNDNDCNPATADGLDETWLGGACDGSDTDLCDEGTFSCVSGLQSCGDTSGDTLEICDGVDNDCNGQTDEGFADNNNNGIADCLEATAPTTPTTTGGSSGGSGGTGTTGGTTCGDSDGDDCDDCANGPADPNNDGLDTDGDGLCDVGDADDDNDGIPDAIEVILGTDPLVAQNTTSLCSMTSCNGFGANFTGSGSAPLQPNQPIPINLINIAQSNQAQSFSFDIGNVSAVISEAACQCSLIAMPAGNVMITDATSCTAVTVTPTSTGEFNLIGTLTCQGESPLTLVQSLNVPEQSAGCSLIR